MFYDNCNFIARMFLKDLLIYCNFSFIVLPIVTMRFVIVLINEHDDGDDELAVPLKS